MRQKEKIPGWGLSDFELDEMIGVINSVFLECDVFMDIGTGQGRSSKFITKHSECKVVTFDKMKEYLENAPRDKRCKKVLGINEKLLEENLGYATVILYDAYEKYQKWFVEFVKKNKERIILVFVHDIYLYPQSRRLFNELGGTLIIDSKRGLGVVLL